MVTTNTEMNKDEQIRARKIVHEMCDLLELNLKPEAVVSIMKLLESGATPEGLAQQIQLWESNSE